MKKETTHIIHFIRVRKEKQIALDPDTTYLAVFLRFLSTCDSLFILYACPQIISLAIGANLKRKSIY